MHRFLFSSLASLLLLGCSGSGGADGSVGSLQESVLLIDTAAGSNTVLTARLAAVTLERPDGTQTPNLLRGETEITIADPAGRLAGFPMLDVPPDVYSALNVMLVAGSVTATTSGQAVAVTPSSLVQHLDFGGRLYEATGRTALLLGHDDPLQLTNGIWTPSFQVRFGEQRLVRLSVEIVSVNQATRRGVGIVRELNNRRFNLDFSETRGVERPELLQGLQPGEVERMAALVVDSSTLRVLALVSGQEPTGMREGLRGEITSIQAAQAEFTIVDERGGAVQVATDSQTHFIRTTNTSRDPITFAALAVEDDVIIVVRERTAGALPLAELVVVDETTRPAGGSGGSSSGRNR